MYTPAVWVHSRAVSAQWLIPREPALLHSELLLSPPVHRQQLRRTHTVCTKSLDSVFIVSYEIKWVKTS